MQLIEARHRKFKAESQEKYSNKLADIQKKFNRSYERCLQQREEKEKENEEKTFKKFQAYYWLKREQPWLQLLERAEKKLQMKDKLALKMERMEQLEKEHDQKRKAIIKKLKNISKRKEEHDREKEQKILENRQIQSEHFEKLQLNQSAIMQKQMTKREEILYMENEKLNRAINKDSGVEVLKMNAQ